jgi:ribosomal protein S17E
MTNLTDDDRKRLTDKLNMIYFKLFTDDSMTEKEAIGEIIDILTKVIDG